RSSAPPDLHSFPTRRSSDLDPRELAAPADTVQFCFSKGLSAPVGSILCGSAETVAKARRVRKLLGGAMRQAGVIAAAALVGLEEDRKSTRLNSSHVAISYAV